MIMGKQVALAVIIGALLAVAIAYGLVRLIA
jgi:hypothetical protein